MYRQLVNQFSTKLSTPFTPTRFISTSSQFQRFPQYKKQYQFNKRSFSTTTEKAAQNEAKVTESTTTPPKESTTTSSSTPKESTTTSTTSTEKPTTNATTGEPAAEPKFKLPLPPGMTEEEFNIAREAMIKAQQEHRAAAMEEKKRLFDQLDKIEQTYVRINSEMVTLRDTVKATQGTIHQVSQQAVNATREVQQLARSIPQQSSKNIELFQTVGTALCCILVPYMLFIENPRLASKYHEQLTQTEQLKAQNQLQETNITYLMNEVAMLKAMNGKSSSTTSPVSGKKTTYTPTYKPTATETDQVSV